MRFTLVTITIITILLFGVFAVYSLPADPIEPECYDDSECGAGYYCNGMDCILCNGKCIGATCSSRCGATCTSDSVCSQDNWYCEGQTRVFKDFYCDTSCGSCSCTSRITQTAENCNAQDGWYGGGNTAGCGDDLASKYNDHYCAQGATNTPCPYTVTTTKDCDSSDICQNICDGNVLKQYKDYYVTSKTNTCAFAWGPVVQNCTNGCVNGTCVQTATCTDSDGGKIYDVKGTVSGRAGADGSSVQRTDECMTTTSGSDTLFEYYCQNPPEFPGAFTYQSYTCPYGCSNGACVQEPTCTDTDGGNVKEVKGTVTKGTQVHTDYCSDSYNLVEKYCLSNNIVQASHYCSDGCVNGACIEQVIITGCSGSTDPNAFNGGSITVTYSDGTAKVMQDSCGYSSSGSVYGANHYYCGNTTDGPHYWMATKDCAAEGKTCSNGMCVVNNTCYVSGTGCCIGTICSIASITSCQSGYSNVFQGCSANCTPIWGCVNNQTNGTCTDSDGGKNYGIKGTVTDVNGVSTDGCFVQGNTDPTAPEECLGTDGTGNGKCINEGFCENGKKNYTIVMCPNGCADGACIQTPGCVSLGEAGPNPSLGPSDPNKDKVCCGGLVLKSPKTAFDPNCELMYGAGTKCIACGDGVCDSNYESTCNCPEDCGTQNCMSNHNDPDCWCADNYVKTPIEVCTDCAAPCTQSCQITYKCVLKRNIISISLDKFYYAVDDDVQITAYTDLDEQSLIVNVVNPNGVTTQVTLNRIEDTESLKENNVYKGTFTNTNVAGKYFASIDNTQYNFEYGRNIFYVYDQMNLERYLILENIGDYIYDTMNVQIGSEERFVYMANYIKNEMSYPVMVGAFDNKEEVNRFMNSIPEQYITNKEKIGDFYVYVLSQNSNKLYVWTYKNLIIIVPFGYQSSGIGSTSIITQTTVATAGMVTNPMPENYCGVDSLESECTCYHDETKDDFMPPCTTGACAQVMHYRCVGIYPKELLEAYLNKFPSDILSRGSECGNNGGYCGPADTTCTEGYEQSLYTCSVEDVKCCVKKVSAEQLLEMIMTLEELKVKMDKLKTTADSISDYYSGIGDTANADRFNAVSLALDDLGTQINNVLSTIRLNKNNIEIVRQEIRDRIEQIKNSINHISDLLLASTCTDDSQCASNEKCINNVCLVPIEACPEHTMQCSDGTFAHCTPIYSSGECGTCTPECPSGSVYCGTDSLSSDCICNENEIKEQFMPVCQTGSCLQVMHHRCVSNKWTWHDINPILTVGPSGSWDEKSLGGGTVVYHDGKYFLYYSGRRADYTYAIGLATSTDGINFTKYSGNPILEKNTTNDWESGFVWSPSVIYHNGTFYMYYTARHSNLENEVIGLATSTDGYYFTRYSNSPVIDRSSNKWDRKWICHTSQPVWDDSTGKWVILYSGGDYGTGASNEGEGVATSTDLKTWTKYSGNPVITYNQNPPSDEQRAYVARTVSQKESDNKWYAYFDEVDSYSNHRSAYATSSDLLEWTRYVNNPVIELDWNYRIGVQAMSIIKTKTGKYNMYAVGSIGNITNPISAREIGLLILNGELKDVKKTSLESKSLIKPEPTTETVTELTPTNAVEVSTPTQMQDGGGFGDDTVETPCCRVKTGSGVQCANWYCEGETTEAECIASSADLGKQCCQWDKTSCSDPAPPAPTPSGDICSPNKYGGVCYGNGRWDVKQGCNMANTNTCRPCRCRCQDANYDNYLDTCTSSPCCVNDQPACFLGGTQITTSYGTKNIEYIYVGDEVVSYNENGFNEISKVTQTFEHNTNKYIIINNMLKVTPNHPMWINGVWSEVGSAKIGDKLKTTYGEEIEIKSIEEKTSDVKVYNLEVSDNHNYYAEGLLAHNKCAVECGEGFVCDGENCVLIDPCANVNCGSGFECRNGNCVQIDSCGDGSCSSAKGENCNTCYRDCKCSSGYECTSGFCTRVDVNVDLCGDGVCQDTENYIRCPDDCRSGGAGDWYIEFARCLARSQPEFYWMCYL